MVSNSQDLKQTSALPALNCFTAEWTINFQTWNKVWFNFQQVPRNTKPAQYIPPWKTDSNHLIWLINIAWRETSSYSYKNKLRGHPVHFLSILTSLCSHKKTQILQKTREDAGEVERTFPQALSSEPGTPSWEVHSKPVLSWPASLCCGGCRFLCELSVSCCLSDLPLFWTNQDLGVDPFWSYKPPWKWHSLNTMIFVVQIGKDRNIGMTMSMPSGSWRGCAWRGWLRSPLPPTCWSSVTWAQWEKVKVHATSLFSTRSSVVASLSTLTYLVFSRQLSLNSKRLRSQESFQAARVKL